MARNNDPCNGKPKRNKDAIGNVCNFILIFSFVLYFFFRMGIAFHLEFLQDSIINNSSINIAFGIVLILYCIIQLVSVRKFLFDEAKKHLSIPFTALLILASIVLIVVADEFSTNQAEIIGNSLTAIAAFLVLLVTFSRENSLERNKARASAKALGQILRSVYNQFERINNGNFSKIVFPQNWMDLYCACASHLKYEYWDSILREFEFVNSINESIHKNEKNDVISIYERRHYFIVNSEIDFDIIFTAGNLNLFGSGLNEAMPWKEQKENIEFKRFFIENYSDYVESLTIEYLELNNNTCDSLDVVNYVLTKIKDDPALSKGKYKLKLYENKVVRNAIFQVFLDRYINTKENKKISLVWGELTLIDTK